MGVVCGGGWGVRGGLAAPPAVEPGGIFVGRGGII